MSVWSISVETRREARKQFRACFRVALADYITSGRPLAEAFGLAFTDSLEFIPLNTGEIEDLYGELLRAAQRNQGLFQAIPQGCSQFQGAAAGSTPDTVSAISR